MQTAATADAGALAEQDEDFASSAGEHEPMAQQATGPSDGTAQDAAVQRAAATDGADASLEPKPDHARGAGREPLAGTTRISSERHDGNTRRGSKTTRSASKSSSARRRSKKKSSSDSLCASRSGSKTRSSSARPSSQKRSRSVRRNGNTRRSCKKRRRSAWRSSE
jgi:hypothetical protein